MNKEQPQNNLTSTLAYHLRNRPGQKRVLEAASELADSLAKRRKKMRVPRPAVPAAPPQATLPAAAPPAPPTTSVEYVMGEINKMAAAGMLPPGAVRRISVKVAQAQAQQAKYGRWGLANKISLDDFLKETRKQINMPAPGKMIKEESIRRPVSPPGPGMQGAGPMPSGDRSTLTRTEMPRPPEMRQKLDDVTATGLYRNLERNDPNALRSVESATRVIDDAAAAADDPRALDSVTSNIRSRGERDPKLRHMAIAGTVGLGALGLDEARDQYIIRRNYNRMIEADGDLKKMDPTMVRSRYRTLAKWSPEMTDDPVTAASTVKKMVEYGEVDPATVKNLRDNQRDPRSFAPRLFGVLARSVGLDSY